jgi:hypothetical protein
MDEGRRTQSVRKVALASFVGTTIEWYDFFLYGTAAALVFDQLFFPDAEPLIGTLLASETFRKDVDEDEAEEQALVRERRFDRERFREPAGRT